MDSVEVVKALKDFKTGKASASRLQVSLSCAVLSICPGHLSIAWLVSLVVFSCRMFHKW